MRLMENAEIVKPDVFGTKAKIMEENENETKYQMQCDTPNGFMHCYHLFPGIDLAYSTFEASSCRMRNRAMPNILEIAYCRAGRFECEYKHGFVTYLGEGDFAVSLLSPEREPPEFPIGYYDGVAFIIDLDITGLIFENAVEGVSINLNELIDKFCVGHCCSVIKTPPNLRHVFQEICEARDTVPMGYLRLKVLESLFLLSLKRIVKDLLIKFTKSSHLTDFITKHTLDFVRHRLCCGLAEMDTHDIGGLVDGLAETRLCVSVCVLNCCCVH